MELYAAIDLLGGRAHRLVQGDYERPIEESADPLALAGEWLAAGVRRLHVVDLEGARAGRPINHALTASLCRLARRAAPEARVQVGGGLRSEESVALLLDGGADDVLLGTAAIGNSELLARCAQRWPGRVGVALDLRNGVPAVAGWTREVTGEDPFSLAESLLERGAARLLITDISVDGTAEGPNFQLLGAFRARFPGAVLLAAGGVATPDHLAALSRLGIDGAVVGRALLDGSLDIAEALTACRDSVAA